MGEQTQPTALRPLSNIELYSSTRHHTGICRVVAVTCRYRLPASTPALAAGAIFPALAAVVANQPMLRIGILGGDTRAARFSHVPEMDLRNHVEFRSLAAASVAAYEAELATLQGERHDQFWPELETRPPWKVVVAAPDAGVFPQACADVMFLFHHSLAGGTGGQMVHEELLAALNKVPSPPSAEPNPLLSFLEPPVLPEGQDEAIGFTSSIPFTSRVLWTEFGPSFLKRKEKYPWGAKRVDFSTPFRTRVLPLDFPVTTLTALLAACRSHSTSLTGLIHALIFASMTRRIPADQAPFFVATTPVSLQPYVLPTVDQALKDKVRVLLTAQNYTVAASAVAAMRAAPGADELLWREAKLIKDALKAHAESLPADDVISLLKYVSNWDDFWKRKDGQQRGDSWEVSNVGVLKKNSADGYRITRTMFTNGALPAGSPFVANVASVTGEGLTIAITWQQDVVDDALMDGIAHDLTEWTAQFVKTGKFLNGQ